MSALAHATPATKALPQQCPRCGAGDPQWFLPACICASCESSRIVRQAMAMECDRTAHELALTDALARIRSMAITTPDGWVDVSFALQVSGPESAQLARGIKYLHLRGCTRPHPTYPSMFRVVLDGDRNVD